MTKKKGKISGYICLNICQYGLPFYMQYMAHWPEYFQVAESPSGEIMGYSKCILENVYNHLTIVLNMFIDNLC